MGLMKLKTIARVAAVAGLLAAGCGQASEKSEPTAVTLTLTSQATTAAPTSTTAPNLPAGAKASDPPAALAVFARIEGLTDCAALQDAFDTAEANGDRERDAGRLDVAELTTRYMTAANDRMQAVDC